MNGPPISVDVTATSGLWHRTALNLRDLLGLKGGAKDKFQPVALDKYRVFVQSTSYNRGLVAGTGFLYEVDKV